jgi:hypothetical protein
MSKTMKRLRSTGGNGIRLNTLGLLVIPLTLSAGCQPTGGEPGGAGAIRPFFSLSDQVIPEDGVLVAQFEAASGVRLRITVTGPQDSSPDFQLAVGEYEAEDFTNVPDGDVQIETAGVRRPGFAEDTFDTVIQGVYTVFIIDEANVEGATFDLDVV